MTKTICRHAVLFILCGCLTFAQEARSTISGGVFDPSGAPIPGVKITVKEVRTGVATSTASDAAGAYNIPFLPPGQYRVAASSSGFKEYVRDGITLSASDHPVIDINLQVGSASETVTVEGSSAGRHEQP